MNPTCAVEAIVFVVDGVHPARDVRPKVAPTSSLPHHLYNTDAQGLVSFPAGTPKTPSPIPCRQQSISAETLASPTSVSQHTNIFL